MWKRNATLTGLLLAWMLVSCARTSPGLLTADDLKDTTKVLARAQGSISRQDRAAGERLFELGLRAERQGNNWGAAVKAFGESALADPRPQAFIHLAKAELRMSRNHAGLDRGRLLRATRDYYGVALALNNERPELSGDDQQTLRRELRCIEEYLRSSRRESGCWAVEFALNAEG